MARSAISMIAFTCMFIFSYASMRWIRIKKVTSYAGARSINKAAERKLLVALLAYVETGTNSWLFFLKYISKVLQGT